MIYGTVNGQHLRITSTVTAADTYRMLTGRFSFSEEWRGLTKIAYFRRGRETYPFLLVRDAIPADAGLNLTAGDWEAAISGYKLRNIAELDEQTAPRLTTNIAALHVEETVAPGDGEFPVIPKTLGEQILAVAEAAAATAADVKRRADEGEFDGTPGKDGDPGTDGYSPSAKVERTSDGAVITITDKTGTTTAKVNDGQGGSGEVPADLILVGDTPAASTHLLVNENSTQIEVAELSDIPTRLSQMTDDSTHRTVTDAEKTAWNAKSNFSGAYDDLTGKPTIPDVSEFYAKPASGIPESDLSAAVQSKLNSGGGESVDVQINGTSIVVDGVANIPIAAKATFGAMRVGEGLDITAAGLVYIPDAAVTNITARKANRALTLNRIDLAVKAAMTDGVGAAWTEAEQLAAQTLLGIISSEGVGF